MTQNKQFRTVYQTPAFRLSYPALFEPKETLSGDMKYSITMLFPKAALVKKLIEEGHPAASYMASDNAKGFYAEVVKVARGNFGPDIDLSALKLTAFKDGDKPKANGKVDENAVGYVVVRTTSKEKPQSIAQNKGIITDPSELYAGCWVRALITVAPFLKPQHGVTVYLNGVQKLADDAAFSSRPRVEDAFDAVASEGGTAVGAGESQDMSFMD